MATIARRVVMICPSKKCRNRVSISHAEWVSGKEIRCGDCGGKMIYHKEEGDEHIANSGNTGCC